MEKVLQIPLLSDFSSINLISMYRLVNLSAFDRDEKKKNIIQTCNEKERAYGDTRAYILYINYVLNLQ